MLRTLILYIERSLLVDQILSQETQTHTPPPQDNLFDVPYRIHDLWCGVTYPPRTAGIGDLVSLLKPLPDRRRFREVPRGPLHSPGRLKDGFMTNTGLGKTGKHTFLPVLPPKVRPPTTGTTGTLGPVREGTSFSRVVGRTSYLIPSSCRSSLSRRSGGNSSRSSSTEKGSPSHMIKGGVAK